MTSVGSSVRLGLVVVVAGCLAALIACRSLGAPRTTSNEPTIQTTTTTMTVAAPPVGIGQEVRNNGFAYTVTDVTKADTFSGHSPQGVWVVVSFTVKNIGNGPESWVPEKQLVRDSEGRTFKPAWGIFDPRSFNSGDEINPGIQIGAKLAYDTPPDMQPVQFELSDTYGSLTVDLLR